MRKADLDHLLEAAVAKALGLHQPRNNNRRMVPKRKSLQPMKHAA